MAQRARPALPSSRRTTSGTLAPVRDSRVPVAATPVDPLDHEVIAARCLEILEGHWRPGGYTVPHETTYPWFWLWDSCFHAVVWAELDDGRAEIELESVLVSQDEVGFVPHMRYGDEEGPHTELWGRPKTSSITQPPMYGHAAAALHRRGFYVPDEVRSRAAAGLRFFLTERRRDEGSGLVTLCHPWESGADDSPRWDHWCALEDEEHWYELKGELLTTVERGPTGAPLSNPAFAAGSVGFNALVVFNVRELASIGGCDDELVEAADELADRLDERWDHELRTWVDAGPSAEGSGRIRTLDSLLPILVIDDADRLDAVAADLLDLAHYGSRWGACGVHRDEPTFDATAYWRGTVWPQLCYLLWLALARAERTEAADELAARTVLGAVDSGYAEHWNPDDGTGLGAIPQSWTTLAALLAAPSE